MVFSKVDYLFNGRPGFSRVCLRFRLIPRNLSHSCTSFKTWPFDSRNGGQNSSTDSRPNWLWIWRQLTLGRFSQCCPRDCQSADWSRRQRPPNSEISEVFTAFPVAKWRRSSQMTTCANGMWEVAEMVALKAWHRRWHRSCTNRNWPKVLKDVPGAPSPVFRTESCLVGRVSY